MEFVSTPKYHPCSLLMITSTNCGSVCAVHSQSFNFPTVSIQHFLADSDRHQMICVLSSTSWLKQGHLLLIQNFHCRMLTPCANYPEVNFVTHFLQLHPVSVIAQPTKVQSTWSLALFPNFFLHCQCWHSGFLLRCSRNVNCHCLMIFLVPM